MNEINGESIESFIVIYNRSRKYCIDKIDQIRCKYKEIDNIFKDYNVTILNFFYKRYHRIILSFWDNY